MYGKPAGKRRWRTTTRASCLRAGAASRRKPMSRRSVSSAARKLSSQASGAFSPSQTIRAMTAVSNAGRGSTTAMRLRPGPHGALCRRALAHARPRLLRRLGDAVPATDRTVAVSDGLRVGPCLRQLPGGSGRVLLNELLSAKAAPQQLARAVRRAGEATPGREPFDLLPLGTRDRDAPRSREAAALRAGLRCALTCVLAHQPHRLINNS